MRVGRHDLLHRGTGWHVRDGRKSDGYVVKVRRGWNVVLVLVDRGVRVASLVLEKLLVGENLTRHLTGHLTGHLAR